MTAFIGLGRMGGAIAEAAAAAGFPVTLYDVDPAAATPSRSSGGG